MRFRSPGPDATFEAGRSLAAAVDRKGLVLVLAGPLGTGKSVFVRGLAAGLGIHPAAVSSPTFTIVNQYPAPDGRELAHADFYRLEDEREVENVAFVDLLRPGAIVAVEWGDRFAAVLPDDRLALSLARVPGAEEARVAEVSAQGPNAGAVLARWQDALVAAPAVELE